MFGLCASLDCCEYSCILFPKPNLYKPNISPISDNNFTEFKRLVNDKEKNMRGYAGRPNKELYSHLRDRRCRDGGSVVRSCVCHFIASPFAAVNGVANNRYNGADLGHIHINADIWTEYRFSPVE